jgi:hypothetical protein
LLALELVPDGLDELVVADDELDGVCIGDDALDDVPDFADDWLDGEVLDGEVLDELGDDEVCAFAAVIAAAKPAAATHMRSFFMVVRPH